MQTIRRFFASLVVLFACQTAAYAQFTISGAIQDELGNPLNDFGAVEVVVLDSGGTEVWRGNNGDGTWTSASLADGNYYAYAIGEPFGRSSEVWSEQDCAFLSCDITAIGAVIPISGGDVTGVNFTLAPIPSYTITGSIQDASGNGIGGLIAIRDQFGEFVADLWVNGDGSPTPSFPIPAGEYVAYASWVPGFVEERWDGGEPGNQSCPNLDCDLIGGTIIDLRFGDAVDIDFVLEPIVGGGRLSGSVIGPDGITPVVGASLAAMSAGGQTLQTVATDRNGNFSFPPLANGDVYLRLDNDLPDGLAPELWADGEPNFVCEPFDLCFNSANGVPITIADADIGALDFQLEVPPGGLIQGRLVDGDLAFPLADMRVTLYDQFGAFVKDVVTDADGEYTFSGLANSTYHVYVSGPTEGYEQTLFGFGNCFDPCDVTQGTSLAIASSGDTITNPDLAMIYAGGPRITGIITRSDTGEPVSSRVEYAGVDLFDTSGNFVGGGPTDRSGRYQLVPPSGAGDYVVITTHEQSFHGLINEIYNDVACGNNCDPNDPARTVLSVPDTGTRTAIADFALDPGASISGTITATDGGAPIELMGVCAEREPEPDYQTSVCVETDASGNYTINGLVPAADYVVYANNFNGLPFIEEVWNNRKNFDFSQGDQLDLTLGDATGINFVLDTAASVSGRVTSSADSTGIQGITVCAESEAEPDYQTSRCADTDANGDYVINGVPALTDIIVWTNGNSLPWIEEVYDNRKDFDFSQGDQLDLTLGDAAGIDFALDPGGILSGQILDETGTNPLNDGGAVEIVVIDSVGNEVWRGNNGDSTWTTQPLPAGTYYAYAFGENFGVTSEVWNDVDCPSVACDVLAVGAPIVITGGNIGNIDFTLAPAQFFTITGSIQDAGGNGVGGAIAIRKANGDFVADIWVNGDGSPTTSFPIPAGQYVVFANQVFGFVEELWNGGEPNLPCPNLGCDYNSGVLVDLTAGDATGIDFVLDPIVGGGRLSGTVTDPLGNPVVGVSVAVMNGRGDNVQYLATDRFGNFNTGPLSNGDVYLRTEPDAPDGLAPELWNGGEPTNTVCVPFDLCFDTFGFGMPITIADGDVGALDFQLTVPGGGQLTGRVVDADLAFPLADQFIQVFDSFGGFVAGTQTDGTGTYTFAGLPDGDYKLLVDGPSEGYEPTLFGFGACNGCDIGANGTVFTVSGGGVTTNLDQPLQYVGGPRITGFVTRTDTGEPVSSRVGYAGVDVFDTSGNFVGGGPTDRSGRYQLVPPGGAGDYVVITTHDQGFHGLINEIYNDVACANNCDPNDPARIVISVPDTGTRTAIADFALDPGRTISGTVTASLGGLPVEGITVCVDRALEPNFPSQCRQTDATGQYFVDGLIARDDYVAQTFNNGLPFFDEVYDDLRNVPILDGARIDVSTGDASGIDFALDPAGFLSGAILDELGNPLNDGGAVEVVVLDAAGNEVGRYNNGDSTWTSDTLAAGDYYAYAFGENFGRTGEAWNEVPCPNATCDVLAVGSPITITGGEVSGIDFTLAPVQEFTISGSIRDADGNSLGGQLTILNARTLEQAWEVFVDGNGNGTAGPIPAGEYIVLAGRRFGTPGFVEELWDGGEPNLPCPVFGCDFFAGTPVNLTAGDVSGIDFVLEPIVSGGRLSGTVVDNLGSPVVGVSLSVLNGFGIPVQDLSTDSNGAFVSQPMPDGDVYLRVENDAGGGLAGELWNGGEPNNLACVPFDICFDLANGQPITIAGGDVGAVDFQLTVPAGGQIVGSFEDLDFGFPLADMNVELLDTLGNYVTNVPTDATGTYTFAGLADGQYKVFISGPTEGYPQFLIGDGSCSVGCDPGGSGTLFTVSGGNVVNVPAEQVPYEGGPRITGIITRTDTGEPVSSRVAYAGADFFDTSGNGLGGGPTDRSGRYQIVPGSAGDYVVISTHDQGFHGLINEVFNDVACGNNCDPNDPARTVLSVPDTGTRTVIADFALDPGASISGTITATDGSAPIELMGVCAEREPEPDYQTSVCVETDANGNYTINGLVPAADYVVWTNNFSGLPFIQEVWNDRKSFDFSQADLVDATTTDAVGIDFGLDAAASINGTITASVGGGALEGVLVDILDSSCNRVLRTGTDASGNYAAINLDPGEYYVYARGAFEGFVSELYPNLPRIQSCPEPLDEGTLLQVAVGQTVTGIDLQLEVGASISGVVSDASGPLPSGAARARLYSSDGRLLLNASSGFFNGQFGEPPNGYLLRGLPAGDYQVVLTGSGQAPGLIDEVWNDIPCPRGACLPGTGDVITLAAGEARTGIDAVLEPGSQISGRVTDDQGNPLASTFINIYDATGAEAGFAQTDANGDYASFGGFPSGTYYVSNQWIREGVPQPVAGGYLPMLWDGIFCIGDCDPTQGDPIVVDGTNPATGIDFVFESRSITGTVRAEDDLSAIGNATVCLSTQSAGFQECQVTDAQGRFAFTELSAIPDYVVAVVNFSGQPFVPEQFDNAPCCSLADATPIDTTAASQDITIDVARSATISGTVTATSDSSAIEGVRVEILDTSCRRLATGFTDASGNYSASGFGQGEYYVYARGAFQNFVSELYPDLPRVQTCPEPLDQGTVIQVAGAQTVAGIDFALDRGASISGVISDINGPIPPREARAQLYSLDGTLLINGLNGFFGGNFGEPPNGYVLLGLPAGDYNVVFSGSGQTQGLVDEIFDDIPCPQNSCPQGTGQTISVAPGEARTGISAVLETGSQISGRLTDAQGNPIQACIAIYTDGGAYAGFACSDANGDYTSPTGFPAGDYLVSNQFIIDGPDPVFGGFLPTVWPDLACGEPCNVLLGDPITVDGINPAIGIDLVFQNGSSISGVVTGNGTPVGGVEVRLLDDSDGALIRTVVSAPDGSYSFDGLAAGDFLLRTSNTLGLNDLLFDGIACNPFCDPLAGTLVNLAPDTDLTGIDFVLTSTPRIVGTVTDPAAAPVGGVRVEAYNSLGALIASATSAPDGSFEIGNLFSGTFFVRTVNTQGFVDALAEGLFCPAGCNPVLDGTPIGVGPSGTFPAGGLDLQLGTAAGVFGIVSDGVNPISAVAVEVYTPTGVLAATQSTGDDGSYAIDGLGTGTYHVITRNGQGFIDQSATGTACPISCAPTSTPTITLGIAQQRQVDFTLAEGRSISGRVSDTLGSSLASVEVTVYSDTGVPLKSAVTDASGGYSVNALLPADYLAATTSNADGLRNRLYDGQACDADCNVLGGTLISLTSASAATGIDFALPDGKSISGTIEASTGGAIGGVRVAAFDASGAEVASAVTGAGGGFSITGLADGVYRLRTFNSLGFIDQAIGGDECTPLRCDLDFATAFDVTPQSQTGAGAVLRFGQALSGTATDETNNPIFSGEAQLYSETADLLKTAPISEGVFNFNGLAGGTYYAVVTNDLGLVDQAWTGPGQPGLDCPGGSCLTCLTTASCAAPPAGPAPIVLVDLRNPVRGGSGSRLNFQLPPGERIEGSITDTRGNPIPNARIYLFSADGADAGQATSDGLGDFQSAAAFSPGSWVAATNKPGQAGVIGFIDELFDDIPCVGDCDPLDGDVFTTPAAPLIEFQLQRIPTEAIFSSGFEF